MLKVKRSVKLNVAGRRVRLPSTTWLGFIALAAVGLVSANPFTTAFAIVMVPLLIEISWRIGEPPILTVGLAYQWLQVSTAVLWADSLGVKVSQAGFYPEVRPEAVALSLVGLVVLAVGVRWGMSLFSKRRGERKGLGGEKGFSIRRVTIAYFIAVVVGKILFRLSEISWSIRQPMLALALVHWVFFMLLAITVFSQKRGYFIFFVALAAEIISNVGYFASFKLPLLLTFVAVFCVYAKPSRRAIGVGVAGFVVLAAMGIVWTAVKMPFRDYVNGGNHEQVVQVSAAEALGELGYLISNLDGEELKSGFRRMVARLEYESYFSATIEHVPSVVPFQGGRLWLLSIENLFPRMLWPGKPILNDSTMTRKYTGIPVATASEGVSIGIGYMGDSYIDFGPIMMFIPIGLLGVLWGGIYSYFTSRDNMNAVSYAVASVALLDLMYFEFSAPKVVGDAVLRLVFLGLILRFFMPRVEKWLEVNRAKWRKGSFVSDEKNRGGMREVGLSIRGSRGIENDRA